MRLAAGEFLAGRVPSRPIDDLNSLPFPRWDLVGCDRARGWPLPFTGRPAGGSFPLLASRGCPEFCTYCPHRILASYRARSVENVADELEYLCSLKRQPYIVFRDPLFSEDRDRCLELCDEIHARGLTLRFECETRLDRLDPELLQTLRVPVSRRSALGLKHHLMTPSSVQAGDRFRPRISDTSWPSAAASASSPLRSTSRVSSRRLGLGRGHDRIRDQSRIDGGAIQAADTVSGHADVAPVERASTRRTGSGSTVSHRRSHIHRSRPTSCDSSLEPRTRGSTCGPPISQISRFARTRVARRRTV